jgi:HSP20 family protein
MASSSRWDPNQELIRLHDKIVRMFGHEAGEGEHLTGGHWSPSCDILETRDAVILRAELPGVRESDVQIDVDGGVLTLRGTREFEKESDEKSYHRIERSYGSFARSFTLPRTVDAENISARLDAGVLEVVMPKREDVRPRKITITAEGNDQGNPDRT